MNLKWGRVKGMEEMRFLQGFLMEVSSPGLFSRNL